MGAVRRGHMLRISDETLAPVFAYMAGDPPAAMENLDHRRGRAYFDRLLTRRCGTEYKRVSYSTTY
ncbi:MAG: hypothetical protein NVSMB2_06850 [Chloroflexota bacterium]